MVMQAMRIDGLYIENVLSTAFWRKCVFYGKLYDK